MMCPWRLIAATVGLCACVRITQDGELNVLQSATSKNGDCPQLVQEFDDLSCRDAEGNQVDFYCCNLLKTCRFESTALLGYYLDWMSAYEQGCSVVFSDFDFSSNMQGLIFVGDETKMCAAGCQTNRRLSEKTAFHYTAVGLQEMCDGKVVASVWEPQLEAARSPMNKVNILDELWAECNPRAPEPEPEPTPAPPPTPTLAPLPTPAPLTAPVNPGVDFSFMTTDLRPVNREAGVLPWLNSAILSRRQRNDAYREEIAGGHTCRSMGAPRDQTYYASSLCYWLPDIKKEMAQDHVGLDWNGGAADFGQPLCEGVLSGEGKCMKCAVCHDNAINKEGAVKFTSFIEEVALPKCKMETEIRELCVNNFHVQNRTLKDENDRCAFLKQSFEDAVSRHEQAIALIRELNNSVVTELPARISDKEAGIAAQLARKQAAQAAETTARSGITTACYNHASRNGWPFWYYRADDETFPSSELLELMRAVVCVHPGLGNDMGPFVDCTACKAPIDAMQSAFDEFVDAAQLQETYQRHLEELQATLERQTTELGYWVEQELLLGVVRQEKTDAWDPEEEGCETTFVVYQDAKASYVIACAPDHYDVSCERACIEIQSIRPEGCGVMEGTMPLSLAGRGGLRNTCRPPQYSWIHGPWDYGAPTEDSFDQCRRVWGLQEPSYAQDIKKAGWLLKAGRFGGWWFGLRKYTWNKRYFVLESGDAVRSGLLRYFLFDPNERVRAEERYDKFIILWDAKSTQIETASKYRRDNDACFDVQHFYRTYVFCVEDGNKVAEVDEWVSLISNEIRFPS